VALFGGTLWVVRAKRELVVGNVAGVAAAVVLTAVLVPVADAKGAAVAMVCAESLLAAWLGVALLRTRPDLRPSLGVLPKVLLALVGGAALGLAPLPDIVAVVLASAAYFGLLFVLRGIPPEIWRAVTSR
jgi:O-antigen/teichoic acid export membrane protein